MSNLDQVDEKMSEFMPKTSKAAVSNSVFTQTYISGIKRKQISFQSTMDDFGLDALILRCGNMEKLVR